MYRVCVRCVMDTSDPGISFDSIGVCNHCAKFDRTAPSVWFPDEEDGRRRLTALIDRVRSAGKRKPYDCVLGLSGGLDSSYLALKANEWGLRPLVMHVDAGWNSELAVANIERIVNHVGFHLHTHVVNWEEMRQLQLAYLRAGVPNQDVPQDHIFAASMYRFASKFNVRFLLSGGNFATECVMAESWGGSAMDAENLHSIFSAFGQGKLRDYRTIGFLRYYVWLPLVKRFRTIRPLNFMPYSQASAASELQRTVGWRPYERKHGESIFTKWFQNYFLPARFGFDKRRAHLSSRVLSGQISRTDALLKLTEPLYDPAELRRDTDYICKKLEITQAALEEFMRGPKRNHHAFANWSKKQQKIRRLQTLVARTTHVQIRIYS